MEIGLATAGHAVDAHGPEGRGPFGHLDALEFGDGAADRGRRSGRDPRPLGDDHAGDRMRVGPLLLFQGQPRRGGEREGR